jgi:hypothetical protein
VPGRSCREQAFLFHLFRAAAQRLPSSLYAVLLDVAKAFGTLDHGQLLDTTVSVGFPGEGAEVVRRLPAGCTTATGRFVTDLQRGAPQGSPPSPFVAVTFFGNLVGVVEKHVAAHPEGAPKLFGAPQQDFAQYLFAVLVFAGDANTPGTSPQWVQGLPNEVPEWAARRHTKFSGSKSETLVASHSGGRWAAPAGTPPLKVQGADTPVVASARYLGLPTRSAGLPDLPAGGYPTKVEAVSQRAALTRKLFAVRTRGKVSTNVDFGLLSTLVKQQLFQKFLFPSPVVRVDTAALGTRLRRELRSLLGLPRRYRTVLLHYQLATWPPRFVAGTRALRFAWRLVPLVWVGQVTRKAWQHEGRTRSKPLFEYGPVKYLGDTLCEYELTWAGVVAE